MLGLQSVLSRGSLAIENVEIFASFNESGNFPNETNYKLIDTVCWVFKTQVIFLYNGSWDIVTGRWKISPVSYLLWLF